MPGRWSRWKPGPVVLAVLTTGGIGLWVVFMVWKAYGILIHPVDVAWNLVLFMTLSAWWTEKMGSS